MTNAQAEASINVLAALRRALLIKRPFRLPQQQPQVKPDKNASKLYAAAQGSHDLLFKANTVFPFNLFPDTVSVDREKLTIANRFFFAVAKITSVPIRDILSVEADVGPFLGSVYLTSRYFYTNPHSINFLWRKDALALQRLLQGYIIANEQEINCSKMDKHQLIALLEDLGKGDTN